MDHRCSHSAIDTYLRPAIHSRGRWPDVYLEMGELGRFALEVQISKPFATEVVARHLHYERENVRLLWIFHQLAESLPQGFHDVITMQRGNAFIFDEVTQAESIERKTLVLKCFLEDGRGGYLKPRLVTLDQLDKTTGRAIFLEDRRSQRLVGYCKEARDRWWKALKYALKNEPTSPFDSEEFAPAWASLRAQIPILSAWNQDYWRAYSVKGRAHLACLFAILCSIAHSAETATEQIYVTRYSGQGSLIAMLNSKMSSAAFAPYANLIQTFLETTPLSELASKASLSKILNNARAEHLQIDSSHVVWIALARLFPEALDGLVRAELIDLDKLPKWAIPPDEASMAL